MSIFGDLDLPGGEEESSPQGVEPVAGDDSPELFTSHDDQAATTKPVDPKGDDANDQGKDAPAPKVKKDRTLIILLAILVLVGGCAGYLIIRTVGPALRNRAVVNTPVPAVSQATPTVAVPQGNPTAIIPTAAPTAIIPTAAPTAIIPTAAPVIMTVSQVGAGAEIMAGWDDPKATVKLPISDESTWKGIASSKEGQAFYVVAVSSDPGAVSFGGQKYTFPDEGFVAVFVTTTPLSVEITTTYNQANGHFNCWAEKYVIPSTQNVDQAAKTILQEWQEREKKPVAFAILSDGTVFKIK